MTRRAIAAGIAAVIAACSDPPPRPIASRPAIAAPAAVDAAIDPGFVGVIVAAESVDVAPPFAGVVAAVHVRPGDAVAAGAVVAELDPRPIDDELRAAAAALTAAVALRRQATIDRADAERRRGVERAAVAAGVSPGTSLDEAELAVARAEAQVEGATAAAAIAGARRDTAQRHRAETRLTARAAGTVALRFRDPGATVAAGAAIVRIVGQGGLRLRFAVAPERAATLVPHATVTAIIDTVDEPVTATIAQVSPALDPASGLVVIEAVLPSSCATLRPGLGARVHAR